MNMYVCMCAYIYIFIGKDPDAEKDWGQEEKGVTEDEMVGWHHWLNGHEFEQNLGDNEGQGNLACCSPLGLKESDMSEWLNNSNNNKAIYIGFPGGWDGKESACNAGDMDLIPVLGKSPGEGGNPLPVFLPRESHGQRSLAGYSPWCCRELNMT